MKRSRRISATVLALALTSSMLWITANGFDWRRGASAMSSRLNPNVSSVWNRRGLEGKRILSLARDPKNPAIVYAGTADDEHGVFKSTDGGASWSVLDIVCSYPAVSVLLIDPVDSNVVYAGGDCLSKSTNGGANWVWLGGEASSLVIDPSERNTLYGWFWGCTDFCAGTLEKSTDGGNTWEAVTASYGDEHAPLTIRGGIPSTVYWALSNGVAWSSDGGANWQISYEGLPGTEINAVAIDPENPNIMYAATGDITLVEIGEFQEPTGVFKSTDAGATWTSLGPAAIVDALAIDPTNSNNVYAGTRGAGVFRTIDAGATWSEFNDGLTNLNVNALIIDPSGTQLHAGTNAGVFEVQLSPTSPRPNTVQFSSSSYSVSEGSPRVDIALSRSGDTTSAASVAVATNDAAGLQDCNLINGVASPRCDYINTSGTISFAAGETSKSFSVAIVDDSYAEGSETFTVNLNNPSGATLGPQSTATVTIIDDDATQTFSCASST